MSYHLRRAFLELLSMYAKYSGDWSKCYYCSRLSSCEDHVLPIAVAKQLPFVSWPQEILMIVPACQQCNSIAGARLFTKLASKKLYIQNELSKRAMRLYLDELVNQRGSEKVSMELKKRLK